MDRRGFIGSILVACAAPAIVRADSLMRIIPMDTKVVPYGGATFYIEDLASDQYPDGSFRLWQQIRSDGGGYSLRIATGNVALAEGGHWTIVPRSVLSTYSSEKP